MQSLVLRIEHQVTAFFLKNSNRKISPEARTDQDKLLPLISKLHPKTFQELRPNPCLRPLTDNYSVLKAAPHGKVREDWADRKLWIMGNNKEKKVNFSVHHLFEVGSHQVLGGKGWP